MEVYKVFEDKVCYVYFNCNIKCIKIMFLLGGVVYIYLCYGIYYFFNVVMGFEGVVYVVFVCGLELMEGQDIMLEC